MGTLLLKRDGSQAPSQAMSCIISKGRLSWNPQSYFRVKWYASTWLLAKKSHMTVSRLALFPNWAFLLGHFLLFFFFFFLHFRSLGSSQSSCALCSDFSDRRDQKSRIKSEFLGIGMYLGWLTVKTTGLTLKLEYFKSNSFQACQADFVRTRDCNSASSTDWCWEEHQKELFLWDVKAGKVTRVWVQIRAVS